MSTKGVWYPDRSKATEKDPPLYLHLSASSRDVLQKAIDLGPLVEDKKDRLREKVDLATRTSCLRGSPSSRLVVGCLEDNGWDVIFGC